MDPLDFLSGGGEMGERIRNQDWAATPLGPARQWPQSLRTAVSILLNSRYPMFLFWGPRLIKIYNDGYRPITGDKHPWALGRPGHEVWPEIWSDIGPMVDRVIHTGEATWSEDLRLFMHRRGFAEEVFFTFSYSPIRDESGGIGGMFCACTETTTKVLGERRLQLLRDLAAAAAEARQVAAACDRSLEVLRTNPQDIPFAALDPGNQRDWQPGLQPIASVLAPGAPAPPGPWPEPPSHVMVLPLRDPARDVSAGSLALGISSRLPFDEAYRGFFELVAAQVAASIANGRGHEQERERAEALAELDRAKTAFFSNVSHEFRTPLTLMLGPVEEGLSDTEHPLPPPHRERQELVRRSGHRLLKLVNTLLDFSRIEAGRAQARFVPTDLAALTADLASGFRSMIERTGVRFTVDCPIVREPAYVDHDAWEKIVLNLLSNAFKFTFEGEIAVTLRCHGDRFDLVVSDTGAGISAADLPRVFDRFHRVEGVRSRTYEGTGIGLALVQELVRLHGGTVRATSQVGRGSAFTVSIPAGHAHLPPDRVGTATDAGGRSGIARAYVEEALGWLPGDGGGETPAAAQRSGARPRIVLADDNADMREYVGVLLRAAYDVEAVADGQAALDAIRREPPDLVLSDVMMPRLDGVGLLRALRADPATAALPVILLSARAGEESRVEGLGEGADDYLIKPFTARELLARVAAQVRAAAERRAAVDREREDAERTRQRLEELEATLENIPVGVFIAHDSEGHHITMNRAGAGMLRLAGGANASKSGTHGETLPFRVLKDGTEVAPEDLPMQRAARLGEPAMGEEFDVVFPDGDTVRLYEYAVPLFDSGGRTRGSVGVFVDLTARKRAEDALREREERLRFLVELNNATQPLEDPHQILTATARLLRRHLGADRCAYAEFDSDQEHLTVIGEDAGLDSSNQGRHALSSFGAETRRLLRSNLPLISADIETDPRFGPPSRQAFRAVHARALIVVPLHKRGRLVATMSVVHRAPQAWSHEEADLVRMVVARCWESLERAHSARELRESDRRKDEFLATLSHELRNPLAPLRNALHLLRLAGERDPSQGAVHSMMERQVNHLVRLVDDLLEMSRISRGALELRKEPVEVAAIVSNALETSDPLIRAGGHEVAVTLSDEPLVLLGDPVRLAQVLANLLNNAAKYTPASGRIEVMARRENGSALVAVRDNGAGISAEALPHIFEMFGRGDLAGAGTAPGGLGIGLSLARRLVEMHGGTLSASSEGPGRGSEFVVRLPLSNAALRDAAANERPSAALPPRRLLVVDDNPDAADSLSMVLGFLGAEVRVARDGPAALAAFPSFQPSVVLLDIGMPGMDGYEVARRIRAMDPDRQSTLVALTGWGQEEDRRRARVAGFDHHLIKPADINALQTLLASLETHGSNT